MIYEAEWNTMLCPLVRVISKPCIALTPSYITNMQGRQIFEVLEEALMSSIGNWANHCMKLRSQIQREMDTTAWFHYIFQYDTNPSFKTSIFICLEIFFNWIWENKFTNSNWMAAHFMVVLQFSTYECLDIFFTDL